MSVKALGPVLIVGFYRYKHVQDERLFAQWVREWTIVAALEPEKQGLRANSVSRVLVPSNLERKYLEPLRRYFGQSAVKTEDKILAVEGVLGLQDFLLGHFGPKAGNVIGQLYVVPVTLKGRKITAAYKAMPGYVSRFERW